MTLVEQQIQKIFEIFMGDGDTLVPSKELELYNGEGEVVDIEEFELDEYLDEFFQNYGFEADQYNIEMTTMFDNPGITIYALSIAWIENGKLHTINETVELV